MSEDYHMQQADTPDEVREPRWGPLSRRAMLAVVSCLIVAASLAGVGVAAWLLNRPVGGPLKEVTIQKGMSVTRIARLLYREGVIRSPRLLELFSLWSRNSRRLTAGVHPFPGQLTTWQVLQELEVPRDVTRDVTIQEGLRREHTARLLAQALGLDESRLIALTEDPEFCRSLGVEANTLEGYLFPETYRFSVTTSEAQVLRVMVSHFFRVFDEQKKARAQEMGFSMHEAVTLASIVEGEAQVDEERPLIAAVYLNRLRKRMRLQADPTVQYAIKDGPRRLFYKDYGVDSPYNTYRHSGLPPGPILSPGEASLVSVLYPAKVEDLYFVAKGDGSHIFSRNAAEHEKAKRQTRWARRRSWNRPEAR
ncbi:MAG: endolytic transglycosylase MltG [bacterium]|nr:endolytic transglycosylase MltG [bacterium]